MPSSKSNGTSSPLGSGDTTSSAGPSAAAATGISSPTSRVLVVSHRLPLDVVPAASAAQNGSHEPQTRPQLRDLQHTSSLQAAINSIPASTSVVWLGWLPLASRSNGGSSTSAKLLEAASAGNRTYIAVDVPKEDMVGHHDVFCKRVLWPVLHYVLERNDMALSMDTNAWECYQRVNRRYADAVVANYQQGDIVWINDYHLLLAPQYIRQALPNAIIGLFFQLPFPSHEVLRSLTVRSQLIAGMLGANAIGFQSFAYARHFMSTCMSTLECEISHAGVTVGSRFSSVGIFPIGIDFSTTDARRTTPAVLDRVKAIAQAHEGQKIILGHDHLDYIQGIPNKLMAFDRFLRDHAEWRGKAVLIQVTTSHRTPKYINSSIASATSSPTAPNALRRTSSFDISQQLGQQIAEAVERINSTYGTPTYLPVEVVTEDLSDIEYLALLTAADACLVTSIRDEINLTTHDYIICQQERKAPLILSEFASMAGCFSSAITINPWNVDEVARAIQTALTMPMEERSLRHKPLLDYIRKYTAAFWCASFLNELQIQARQQLVHVPSLNAELVAETFRRCKRRLFMLDYDGTLTPIVQTPDAAHPSAELLTTLNRLTQDPNNCVYIISGRDQVFLENMIGAACPLVGLSAEHGTFFKSPQKDAHWEDMSKEMDLSWKAAVLELFQLYSDRTPGSFVEQKRSSVTWHYRLAEPQYGTFMAHRCMAELETLIVNFEAAEILVGKKNIEVRPKAVNKGCVIERLLHMFQPSDFIFCAGDDRTDEDMFKSLQSVPGHVYTCLVGPPRKTLASSVVSNPVELIHVLTAMSHATEA